MATFRIDQPGGAGTGTTDTARWDLDPGFAVVLTAISPAPGPGVTYAWEIIDKVGSTAVLSDDTGTSVTLDDGGVLSEFCGFRVRLTANDNGTITTRDRVFGVVGATGNRPPLFGEQAPSTQTLAANDPALSMDNAVYDDLAGRGTAGQNPFGWREWAWRLSKKVEDIFAATVEPAPMRITGCSGATLSDLDNEAVIGGFGAFDPSQYTSPTVSLEVTALFSPGSSGTARVRLYDMGTRVSPTAGTLCGEVVFTVSDEGVLTCRTTALSFGVSPDTDTIVNAERVYELRAILSGATPGDAMLVDNATLVVLATLPGGAPSPRTASYFALSAAGLPNARIPTFAKSVVGIDHGPGSAFNIELEGDDASPGPSKVYGTDGSGNKGWQTASGGSGETVLFELNTADLSQFDSSPAPSFVIDSITNPALTLGAGPYTGTIIVGADGAVGGSAGWLFTDPVPILSIKRIEMSFSFPTASPSAASGESVYVGFIYGGDDDTYAITDVFTYYDDGGQLKTLRVVTMIDYSVPASPVTTELYSDDAAGATGFSVRHSAFDFDLVRDDDGDLVGFLEVRNNVWVPPPTTGAALPHGLLVGFIPGFLVPPAGMGASAMNRIGVVFGGNFGEGTGASGFPISRFKVIG